MIRDEAYKLLTEMMSNQNLIKHGLAVEVIMRALCKYLKARHLIESETLRVERPERSEGSLDEDSKSADSSSLTQNDVGDFDEEEWAIVGLLHDADYELVEKDPTRHTLVTEEKLRPFGVSDRVINGIKAHHDGIKQSRDNLLEKSVYAADDMSGLITAVALVMPDRKLSSVKEASVLKKFRNKDFAKGAKRQQILTGIEELNITLEDFIKICLGAMQSISNDLGL